MFLSVIHQGNSSHTNQIANFLSSSANKFVFKKERGKRMIWPES
jgi:hypothetical protein